MSEPARRSRLGVLSGMFLRAPFVERHAMLADTSDGLMLGSLASIVATMPATAGVAIEVPVAIEVLVSLETVADLMLTPGAKMSTHAPWLLPLDGDVSYRRSFWSVAPTTIVFGSVRGDTLVQRSAPLLPAAATKGMPVCRK